MEKKTLSAKAVLQDMKEGLSDDELMENYGLTRNGLQSLFGKLLKAGLVTQAEMTARQQLFTLTSRSRSFIEEATGTRDAGSSVAATGDEKVIKLREAFESGILTKHEYEAKLNQLSGRPSSSLQEGQVSQSTRPITSHSLANLPDLNGIHPYYHEIFTNIENNTRRHFNMYAGFFGVLWYFYKGMWKKGLVYLGVLVILGLLIEVLVPSLSAYTACMAVAFGAPADWDYYLYRVQGEDFFTKHCFSGTFPPDLQRRLC